MIRAFVVVAALIASGCLLESASHVCSDGRVCPSQARCSDVPKTCLLPDQLETCVGRADGESCEIGGTAPGRCTTELCLPEVCGDGIVVAPESCDGAVADDLNECSEHDYYVGTSVGCNADCTFDLSGCSDWCGDGVVNGPEDCDGTAMPDGVDCRTLGFYDATPLSCTSTCGFNTSSCAGFCGDREVNGNEYCEGPLATSVHGCTEFNFDEGPVTCNSLCAPDFASCRTYGSEAMTSGTTTPLRAVWAANSTSVFAVGDDSTVLHYDGAGWTAATLPPTFPTDLPLRGVWGSSASNVFVVGASGTVLRYNGSQWSASPPLVGNLTAVWGSSETNVYVTTSQGWIYRFDGLDWSKAYPQTGPSLNAIWGSGPDDIYAVGPNSAMLHWNGVTWSAMNPTGMAGQPFVAVSGTSADDVFVSIGFNNTVWHFNGTTWQPRFNPLGVVTAFAVTDAVPLMGVTSNGAVSRFYADTWSLLIPATTTGFVAATAIEGDVYFVGTGGQIRRVRDPGWYSVPTTAAQMNAVDAVNESVAYAVGSNNTFYGWDGVTWSEIPGPGTNQNLYHVWAAAKNNVFVVGDDGLHRYDGTWTHPISTTTFVDVWGTSATNVYVVGLPGAITHYDGASYTPIAVPGVTNQYLLGVWGSGPDDIFVVGAAGLIVHYDGAWSVMPNVPTTQDLEGVWGSGPDDVFAVGRSGTILHYDGSAWTTMRSNTTAALADIDGRGPSDVIAVGSPSTVMRFDGISWSPVSTPVASSTGLYGIATFGHDYVAVGALGTIIRRRRSCSAWEQQCGNGDDDDCDGTIDCLDSDCAAVPACAAGGACAGAQTLACATSVMGLSDLANQSLTRYACSESPAYGGQATYAIDATTSGPMTVSLTQMSRDHELFVLAKSAGGGCDPGLTGCLGASATGGDEQVTFTATSGERYYVVVDGYARSFGTFSLSLACP